MRRKTALIVGALLPLVMGLSACGQQDTQEPVRVVQAAIGTETTSPSPTTQSPLTSDPHDLIRDDLARIEGKVDKLAPGTVTKTVTQTTTAPPPPPVTTTVTQTVTSTATSSSTPTSTSTAPPTTTTTAPPTGQQTLGVSGVASPPDARPLPAIVNGKSTITTAGIYDCKGGTINAQVVINASNTTVQNCNVRSGSQYGIYSDGESNTIQNNDIKNLKPTGDGDMNAITFFGNKAKIQFNTAIDFVGTNPGDSHTDFIQTWVSSSHKVASDDVVIRGNKATGPANPSRLNSVPSIHQWLMVEDYGRGGNSGGNTDGMKNWLVIGNIMGDSWNQSIKNDGVDGMVITKNDFIGSSTSVMHQANGSGLLFYSDNKIGSGYGKVGVPITSGAGPV